MVPYVRRGAVRLLIAMLTVVTAASCRSIETAKEIEGIVVAAGVVGESPSSVDSTLRALRFAHGRKLEVGSFDDSRRLILSSVRDADGGVPGRVTVHIEVRFDSMRRATSVRAFDYVVNPL